MPIAKSQKPDRSNQILSHIMKTTGATDRDRVLLIDDDKDFRSQLSEQLDLQGCFEVEEASTAAEALVVVRKKYFKAVILDVGLPDMDGREVCRVMRRRGIVCPIIMLTALNADSDAILGLDRGANDYSTKPVSFNVLLARIRAHIRQYDQCDDAELTVGPYTFKPGTKKLIRDDKNIKINLSEKETRILKRLYRSQNTDVPKANILSEIWGYSSAIETHTLETHIYRLRRKIEEDPSDPKILVSSEGCYRLNA